MADSPQQAGGEPQVEIVVSVDAEHGSNVARVADGLRAAGMSVAQTLEEVGVVTGSAPESRLPDLQQVEGVAAGGGGTPRPPPPPPPPRPEGAP
ncbi:MAG: hypothetical protein ACM3UV_03485, partial [Nocardioidaceae bacterium]